MEDAAKDAKRKGEKFTDKAESKAERWDSGFPCCSACTHYWTLSLFSLLISSSGHVREPQSSLSAYRVNKWC